MTKANLTKNNYTKNILAILTSIIMALTLSFTIFVKTAYAENDLPVDFVIGTTDLRQANSYNNDNVTLYYTPSADGKYVKWGVDENYYNIEESFTNSVTVDYPIITSVKFGSEVVTKNKIATINDYYKYDTSTHQITFEKVDNTKYYRYSDAEHNELNIFGNYLFNGAKNYNLNECTIEIPTNYNLRQANFNTSNSKKIYIDITTYNGDQSILNQRNINTTYNRSYDYGYNYTQFKNDFSKLAACNNPTQNIKSIKVDIDNVTNYEIISTDINSNILVPTLDNGSIIYVNDKWQNIEYCYADGTIDATQPTTKYAILQKDTEGKVLVWAELNTQNYFYKEGDIVNKYSLVSPSGEILPKLYAYKLSNGVYYEYDNDDYRSLKDVSIFFDTTSIKFKNSNGDTIKNSTTDLSASSIDNLTDILYKSNYYYDIYKAIYDGDNIIGYDLYNQEIKTQSNYRSSGSEAFINTYYSNDNLNQLYYYDSKEVKEEFKFKNVFSNIMVNSTENNSVSTTNKQVLLNNYKEQSLLYRQDKSTNPYSNINNLYISFGDVYHETYNNNNIILSSLSVEIKLYNSFYNGIKINSNSVVAQDKQKFEGGDEVSNNFWFQYFDLNNLTYSDDNKIVEHSSGRYVINFLYTTYNIAEKRFSSQQNYSYTIDIDESTNKTYFPVVFTDDSVEISDDLDYPNYYYNFQTQNFPQLIYDASEFDIRYSYKYNQYTLDYVNNLYTYSRSMNTSQTTDFYDSNGNRQNISQPIKTASELSFVNTIQSGYINNEYSSDFIKQTRISAKATIVSNLSSNVKLEFNGQDIQKITVLEYIYESKDSNIISTEWTNSSNVKFDKKIVVVVCQLSDGKFRIFTYKTTDENASSESWFNYYYELVGTDYNYTISVNSPSNFNKFENLLRYYNHDNKDYVKGSEYIELENDFNAIKFSNYFNHESVKFDYLIVSDFEELGNYTFNINYVTAIRLETSNNVANGISTSTSQKIVYNNISFADVPVKSFIKTRVLDDIAGVKNFVDNGYKLDVFGFKSYFNRYDVNNNSPTKSELKETDSDIYSDVTSYIINNGIDLTKSSTELRQSSIIQDGTIYKSIIKVPNTNQVPIYFDYLAEFAYSNKISESLIYRYSNFKYTDDEYCIINNINNYKVNYFDKNSRPEDDGYYEIIIKYNYNNKTHTQVFAFVIDNSSPEVNFSTLKENIIDNQTKYSSWQSMSGNAYTSSPVRSTWRTASYFQYEIIPSLTKSNYTGITNSYGSQEGTINYNLTNSIESIFYIQLNNNIKIPLSGNVTYYLDADVNLCVDKINGLEPINYFVTSFSGNYNLKKVPLFKIALYDNEGNNIGYVTDNSLLPSDMYNQNLISTILDYLRNNKKIGFELLGYQWQFIAYPTSTYPDEYGKYNNSGSLWGSGDYYLKLTYGSSASSNLVSKFVIDTMPISNITSKRVNIGETTSTISTIFSSNSNNLINEPFTLTYSKKSSGAGIDTYYYSIPLSAMADPTSIALQMEVNSKIGVSTDTWLTASSIETIARKKYIYNFSYKDTGDIVPTSNVLQTSGSALYVFELEDKAGNKANYYVIYDTTTPKYALTLSEEDKNSTQYELYKIITETTTVSWGNYKAIEILDNGTLGLDLNYINKSNNDNSIINYQPNAIEKALNYLNNNSNIFNNTLFRTFWYIKNSDSDDSNYKWVEVNLNGKTDEEKADELTLQNKTIKRDESGKIIKKHYILVPLSNTTFNYYSTSGNDNSDKAFTYDMTKADAVNKTIVSPSAKDLSTATGVSVGTIKSSDMGTYGFYGQNKYFYYVYDVLGNFSGGTFWMNNDLTQAFAYILNSNSSEVLSASSNLDIIDATPYSVYAGSQLYFSFRESSSEHNIPSADFAYKYYPFELGADSFYTNYTISNIKINNINNMLKYVVTFAKVENGNITDQFYTYEINATDTNNYNQDGEKVDEKLSSYPFSLKYESGNASDNGWVSITGDNTYTNLQESDRKYTNLINLSTDTTNENQPDCTYTAPGLYVFRRVYTDFVNSDTYNSSKIAIVDQDAFEGAQNTGDTKLRNDQVIQYYVYYIDRYSIIDVSNYIGSDISMIFGEYINTATEALDSEGNPTQIYNENYHTIKNYSEIKLNSNYDSTYRYAGKSYLVNNINNSKAYTEINIPIDKYNQMKIVENQMEYYNQNKTNIDSLNINACAIYYNVDESSLTETQLQNFYIEFIAKYLFDNYNSFQDNYYNTKFLLDVNLSNGSDNIIYNNNILNGKSGLLNVYSRTNNSETISDAGSKTSRLDLTNYNFDYNTSLILNNIVSQNSYNIVIKDRSQSNKLLSNSNNNANFDGNKYTIDLNLDNKFPTASLLTKNSITSTNNYKTNNMDNYKEALFGTSGDIGTGDINKLDQLDYKPLKNGETLKYYDSNKEVLVFFIDNSTIGGNEASTNPYQITITKQQEDSNKATEIIFQTNMTFSFNTNGDKVASYTYSNNSTNSVESMQNAFIDNSYFKENANGTKTYIPPTMWAIIVFDNDAKNDMYHNLLSNAKDNATYTINISHYGTAKDYTGSTTIDNSKSKFTSNLNITQDHEKPLYNLINLMEQDTFVKKSLTPPTYKNIVYQNIEQYYNALIIERDNGNLTDLQIQKYLKDVYNYYIKFYLNTNYLDNNTNYLIEKEDQFGEIEQFWNNYYFTIDENFTFVKSLSDENGTGLDCSQNMFIRKINSNDIGNYYYSLTIDDYTNSADLNNHNIFQDSNASNLPNNKLAGIDDDKYYRLEVNSNDSFSLSKFNAQYNCFYEIIDRDSAGNYRVYLVKYTDSGNSYKINYISPNGENNTDIPLNSSNPVYTTNPNDYRPIIGQNLTFTNAGNVDTQDIIRIELTYAFKIANDDNTYVNYSNVGKPIVISSTIMDQIVHVYYDDTVANKIQFNDQSIISSTTQAISQDKIIDTALDKLNTIMTTISNMYKDSALDFAFNIVIYDRQSECEKFEVDYLTQGKELQLIIRNTSEGFYITIPEDEETRCTKIFSLEAYTYNASGINSSPLEMDSNGVHILNNIQNTSLGGKTFYFKYYTIGGNDGAYKIVTKDNFGRESIHYYSRPDSVKYQIDIKNEQTLLDTRYTASNINIKYNSQLFNVFIYEDISTSEDKKTYNIVTKFEGTYPITYSATNVANNPIEYDSTNEIWKRHDIANSNKILYTVKRTISGPTITVTIEQNIDVETKFIILVVERPNEITEQTKNIYNEGLYMGYYQFISKFANDSNCIYDDNTKITMYTKIPSIQLMNLSGKIITDSKKQQTGLVFIENLKYTKTTEDTKFPTKLSITKNGLNYSNTNNLLSDGKYVITLTNDLQYKQTIQFEINTTNSTSDYSVYTKKGVADSNPTNLTRSDYVTKMYYNLNSNSYEFNNPNNKDYKEARLYHYYTLNNYFNYKKDTLDNTISADTSKNHIYIIVNSNNLLDYNIIDYKQNDTDNGTYSLYMVKDSNNNVIEFFIIHFIDKNIDKDFSGMTLSGEKVYSTSNAVNSSTISKDNNKLYIIMANTSNGGDVKEYLKGNTVNLTYYYNSSPVESVRVDKLSTFKQGGIVYYYYEISETGVHKIEITDLAGNKSIFYGQKYINIYLVNSILYTINDNSSIPNYITNSEVTLKLIENVENVELYKINTQEINITRNGLVYSINQSATNEYKFTEAGTYVITVSATNERNLTNPTVTHTIEFTIVNYNVAYNSYTISSAKGFTITKVTKKLENIDTARENELPELANKNSLLISCDTTGSGYYKIYLSKYIDSKKANEEYSFEVWLNDRTDSTIIIPSIPFGTETTDTISLRYNPLNIFNNVGDSYITINDDIIETITKESLSETKTYEITSKGTYWIKIMSANGQVLASYKLTKNDPLNTTAKIIIIIAVVSVVALVIIFIILRRKTKFR